MFYAQLNDKGICVAVSQLSAKVERENMIALESYDTTICGKKYSGGKWEEVYKEPQESEPTEMQILAQQIADLELAIMGGK